MKSSTCVSLLLLLLGSPLWADSVTGTVTVTEKPGRVVNSSRLNVKTGKMSKVTRAVKNDRKVTVSRPRDVVVAYNRASETLSVDLIERTLTLDEKKYTAVSALPDGGHAYISTIQKVAYLTIPVRENHGKLEVRGDAEFGAYGGMSGITVPASSVDLSGSLQRGVRVHSKGMDSSKSSDVRWDFRAQGKVFDPTERAVKYFPPIQVGNREVEVHADWEPEGTPYLTIHVSEEGKKARGSSAQQIGGATKIRRLVAALERREDFTHRGFRLVNESGTYSFTDSHRVVLDRKDSARLAEDVKAAARSLGIK